MKTKSCLALVLTSALAIGCAAARAQDGQGDPPPASQPAGPPPERPGEFRLGLIEERIRDAEQRVTDAEAHVAQLRRNGFGDAHPEVVAASEQLQRARAAVDRLRAERGVMVATEELRQGQRPQGPGLRPKLDPAEMKRQMTERLAMIEKQIADATSDGKLFDAEEVEELKRHAEMLRALIARIDKGEMPFPRDPGDRMRARVVDALGRELDARVVGRGPMNGPGPSVEQRLEMLERAVREMHDMFERHGVPPEARERAEREMRDRRDGGRPGEGPGPGARPEMGGPPPMGEGQRPGERPDDGREQRPPRPPMPRPGMPKFEMSDVEKAEVKTFLAAKEAEMDARMKQFAQQMEEMKKQLVEARAALEKAQAEVERLRAEKPGK